MRTTLIDPNADGLAYEPKQGGNRDLGCFAFLESCPVNEARMEKGTRPASGGRAPPSGLA